MLSGLKNRRFRAAEILSALSVRQFMMMAQAHGDSVRDSAHFMVVRNGMAGHRLYLEDPRCGSLGCCPAYFEGTVDRRYLMVLLFEYAATQGLVDVRYVDSHVGLGDYEGFRGPSG